MSINLDFKKGTIKEDLAQLPMKITEAAWEEIIQAITLMKGLAQVYVPVDTGSLRDSIRVQRTAPESDFHRSISLRAGGYITNPKTGKIVDYAVHVEQRQPFMRPAFEEVKGTLTQLIKRNVLLEANK